MDTPPRQIKESDMMFLISVLQASTGPIEFDGNKLMAQRGFTNPVSMTNRISNMNTRYGLKLKTARGTTTWLTPKRANSKPSSVGENGISKSPGSRKTPSRMSRKKQVVEVKSETGDEATRTGDADSYEWMSFKDENDF